MLPGKIPLHKEPNQDAHSFYALCKLHEISVLTVTPGMQQDSLKNAFLKSSMRYIKAIVPDNVSTVQ